METIRIVLAEDHALVREGTHRILEQYSDLTVIGEAADGEEALECCQSAKVGHFGTEHFGLIRSDSVPWSSPIS